MLSIYDELSWISTEEPVQKLTELWPDICKARVPQTHIELVVSGGTRWTLELRTWSLGLPPER